MDSSAFAKRYIYERGTERVDEIAATASSLGLSVITHTEVISALCRRRREERMTRSQYIRAKQFLQTNIADADIVAITTEVIARAIEIMERWPLRASDSIHIASAAEWGCDRFVSADDRQIKSASALGLRVEKILS